MTNGSGLDIISLWRSVVSAVDEEAYGPDPQLASLRDDVPRCARALLVFLAADASGSKVDDGTLIRTATAIELLGIGISRHYEPPADTGDPQLDLIAGDFWCARSMQVAASLGRPWLNGLLAGVVAETAVAESELSDGELSAGQAARALGRRAELYATACEVAVAIGAPEYRREGPVERWREAGRRLGVLKLAASDSWATVREALDPDHLSVCRAELTSLIDEYAHGPGAESLRAYCESTGDWTPGGAR